MITTYIERAMWYINHYCINHPDDQQAKEDFLIFKKELHEEEKAERERTAEYYDRLQEARNYDSEI